MKKNSFCFASYLTVLVLAVVTMFNVSSCSKDDDGANDPFSTKALVGKWKGNLDNTATATIRFNKDGEGWYENTYGTTAEFTYEVTSQGIINYDIVWWYKGGGYKKDKYYWSFWIKGDTLYLDNRIYTRQ